MTPTSEPPTSVGQHLRRRREELDLTQGALAARLGVTVTTVSAAERGRSTIMRGKRPAWEQALQLKPGTISRAYRDGTSLEPLDTEPEPPYANLADPKERAIWEMNLSESDRRELIDMIREHAARKRQQGRNSA